MLHRELTFSPETERTRDLAYSECTSCDRSVHLLLQDRSVGRYRFLLQAYREVVARYMSFSRIETPVSFLNGLATRLEALSNESNFSVADLKEIGFFLLLRGAGETYVLLSRDDAAFVHDGDVLVPIAESSGVERVRFNEAVFQEELFPEKLRDSFILYRFDPAHLNERDIVLGCGEEDKSVILDALRDPALLQSGQTRSTISSRFIARKIVSVRLQPPVLTAQPDAPRTMNAGFRRALVFAGGLTAFALVLVFATGRLFEDREALEPFEGTPAPTEEVAATAGPVTTVPPSQSEDQGVTEPVTPQFNASWQKTSQQGVTASPVIFGKTVVYAGRDGRVSALDCDSGQPVWTHTTSAGIGASPALAGGVLIVANYEGWVYGLDARSGEELWSQQLPGRVVSSPAIAGRRIVVGCFDGYAYCLSLESGTRLWSRKTGGRIRGSCSASDSLFFVPSYDGHVYALTTTDGDVAWKHKIGGNLTAATFAYGDKVVTGGPDGVVYALNAGDGSVKWTHKTGAPIKSTPLVYSGLVYVGSNDNNLYCLNGADGSLMWKSGAGDIVLARPAVRDGYVYFGSYDGYVYCVNGASGERIDRFKAGSAIYSSPCVDAAAVFFGTNGGLFQCITYRQRGAS